MPFITWRPVWGRHTAPRVFCDASRSRRFVFSLPPSPHSPDGYHYCTVPHSGEDAILFIGVAVVAACVLRGKLATTLLLGAGALLAGVVAAPHVSLGRLGNAVSWFLSIVPVS